MKKFSELAEQVVMPMKTYSEKYDAFYDPKTGEWLEKKCGSPRCDYCAKRPEKMEKKDV